MHISVRQRGGPFGATYGSEIDTAELPSEAASRICQLVSEVKFFSLPGEIRQIDGRDGVRYELYIEDDARSNRVQFDSTAYATTTMLKEIAEIVARHAELQIMPPNFYSGDN